MSSTAQRAQKEGGAINGQSVDPDDPQVAKIQRLMASNDPADRQMAIDLIVDHFGIDLTSGDETFQAVYDPNYSGDGYVDYGRINIGTGAFRGGIGWLGSTIHHEMVHIHQGYRYATSMVSKNQFAIDEYRAYTSELGQTKRFGLSQGQIENIQKRQ